jgi:hypothetical protein
MLRCLLVDCVPDGDDERGVDRGVGGAAAVGSTDARADDLGDSGEPAKIPGGEAEPGQGNERAQPGGLDNLRECTERVPKTSDGGRKASDGEELPEAGERGANECAALEERQFCSYGNHAVQGSTPNFSTK